MTTANTPAANSGSASSPEAHLARQLRHTRRYLALGFLTFLGFFAGLGGWAATTDLAGAVLAGGVVVVDSNVKKIQHPTGGIVGKIFVRNGDHVKTGDMLLELDETITRANLQVVSKQMDELSGQRARLIAERDDKNKVSFAAELLNRASQPDIQQILAGEQSVFERRIETRSSQKTQLGKRIAAIQEQIEGLKAQVDSKTKEIDLIADQLKSLEYLETKQLVPTSRMIALRRDAARIEGERAQLLASIGQSKGQIAEIEVQRIVIDVSAKSDVVKDLREAESKLAELDERRVAALDQLRRTDIRSPVDGIVHQMTVFTVGGVVSTTEPVMMIVPEGDKLVVEAKISPNDIDQVRHASVATIRFPAFNRRSTPSVEGHLATIAADLTKDPQANTIYFVARITLPPSELAKLDGLTIVPGMPAEVQISTEPRTALTYLLKPITDQYARAFKER